ncbi:signal recognition particle 19 kDa protein [Caldisphaera lagunensis DSM 15908]|uniref:Signal recognition particle 19 kDa protein n=1 Tax=Caldisphaera lagunensis (strain DSM 15908 / JCM 11604 / ANMR 0165 / IC-154) TaxID=1056495 RepID=L0A7P7_CALLD|nr:signal recognition particle subunit SRP19/SEC65 family protein [Caldisphaera lagunensis]AFZ69846.1 signal recognition particle 19 kDa protein [Caldisphaera lagunensis DSM 15908]
MPKEDKYIIWPCYIDSAISKNNGRKISKGKAVLKPSIEEIINAAKKLGFNAVVEEKKYPRLWIDQTKRIVIPKVSKKRDLLIKISEEIIKARQKSK